MRSCESSWGVGCLRQHRQSQSRQRYRERKPVMTAQDPRRTIRKLNLIGLGITVLLIGGVGGWASTAQLAGAGGAPGASGGGTKPKKGEPPPGRGVGGDLDKGGPGGEEGRPAR